MPNKDYINIISNLPPTKTGFNQLEILMDKYKVNNLADITYEQAKEFYEIYKKGMNKVGSH